MTLQHRVMDSARQNGLGVVGALALAILLAAHMPGANTRTRTETAAPTALMANTTDPGALAGFPQTVAVTRSDGIVFGRPIAVTAPEGGALLVLATNTTDRVQSFTVEATLTYRNTAVATLAGAIDDLGPGEMRAVDLLAMDGLPETYDSIRLRVGQVVQNAPTTPESEVAATLKFGALTLASIAGFGQIYVPVTNEDGQRHSFTVKATFLRNGQLVGDAVGEADGLLPGQTKRVHLLPLGDSIHYDRALVAVNSISE
jgi:hypothetical protein